MGERELGCIGIWVYWEYFCALLYLSIFIVKFLRRRRGGRQFAESRKFLFFLCVCLLFNFCLFTIIDLNPKVLSTQHTQSHNFFFCQNRMEPFPFYFFYFSILITYHMISCGKNCVIVWLYVMLFQQWCFLENESFFKKHFLL